MEARGEVLDEVDRGDPVEKTSEEDGLGGQALRVELAQGQQ